MAALCNTLAVVGDSVRRGALRAPEPPSFVTVVILSAVIPTLIATTLFEPEAAGDDAFEDFEAADEIDAGPLRRPRRSVVSNR